MSKPIRFLVVGGALTLIAFLAAVFLLPKPQRTGLVAGEDIPFYSMPWGDNPFAPGNLQRADGKMLDAKNIPTAEFCAQCHEKEYREWVSSIHSLTGPDILYETAISNNEVAHKNRLGTEKIRWCDSCHELVNLLMGEIKKRGNGDPAIDDTRPDTKHPPAGHPHNARENQNTVQ